MKKRLSQFTNLVETVLSQPWPLLRFCISKQSSVPSAPSIQLRTAYLNSLFESMAMILVVVSSQLVSFLRATALLIWDSWMCNGHLGQQPLIPMWRYLKWIKGTFILLSKRLRLRREALAKNSMVYVFCYSPCMKALRCFFVKYFCIFVFATIFLVFSSPMKISWTLWRTSSSSRKALTTVMKFHFPMFVTTTILRTFKLLVFYTVLPWIRASAKSDREHLHSVPHCSLPRREQQIIPKLHIFGLFFYYPVI